MNIEADKKYQTKYGQIIVAGSDRIDADGAAAFLDSHGLWLCLDPEACGLTEVVEIPERWINVDADGCVTVRATRGDADGDACTDRILLIHVRSDASVETIRTDRAGQ